MKNYNRPSKIKSKIRDSSRASFVLSYLQLSSDQVDLSMTGSGHVNSINKATPKYVVYDKDLCSRKRWKHAQVMTQHFWKRWLRECLPALTERRKWTNDARNVREGDLVLVVDENSPRGCWPLARVLRVLPGDDGRVRAAEVRTKSGTYIRPVVKLCLLEGAK
ncbi:hypothetical protein ACROYT_G000445 [Oculina patagonica]